MMKGVAVFLFLMDFVCVNAQITLQPVVPAVGIIQKEQLWNILLVNSSVDQFNACRIDFVLKDRLTNTDVLTASSNIFSLSPGAKQVNVNSLNPIQYNYLSAGVASKSVSIIPVGSYIACYTLRAVGIKEIGLTEECIPFDIEPLSPPMLIYPADSSVLNIEPTQFSWIPPSPATMFNRLNYDIIITPVNEGQKAEEALQQNIPLFNTNNLLPSFLNYTPAYSSFEKDKWYAWQVIARDDRNYGGKTEAWVFKIDKDAKNIEPLTDVYLLLQNGVQGAYEITTGKIHVKYVSPSGAYRAKIIFRDEKGVIVKSENKQIVQGDNYLDFQIGNRFKQQTVYTISLTDIDNKAHSITFTTK